MSNSNQGSNAQNNEMPIFSDEPPPDYSGMPTDEDCGMETQVVSIDPFADMKVAKSPENKQPKKKHPNNVLSFGKYNGMSLQDVYFKDFEYLKWLSKKAHKESTRAEAMKVIAENENNPKQHPEKAKANNGYKKQKSSTDVQKNDRQPKEEANSKKHDKPLAVGCSTLLDFLLGAEKDSPIIPVVKWRGLNKEDARVSMVRVSSKHIQSLKPRKGTFSRDSHITIINKENGRKVVRIVSGSGPAYADMGYNEVAFDYDTRIKLLLEDDSTKSKMCNIEIRSALRHEITNFYQYGHHDFSGRLGVKLGVQGRYLGLVGAVLGGIGLWISLI